MANAVPPQAVNNAAAGLAATNNLANPPQPVVDAQPAPAANAAANTAAGPAANAAGTVAEVPKEYNFITGSLLDTATSLAGYVSWRHNLISEASAKLVDANGQVRHDALMKMNIASSQASLLSEQARKFYDEYERAIRVWTQR